ncbi:MAG: hypothetical protein NG740_00965 [Omnitrophica bacterium]|nr:hypothetical protein [Candidatus Omnitrophota bacterium]
MIILDIIVLTAGFGLLIYGAWQLYNFKMKAYLLMDYTWHRLVKKDWSGQDDEEARHYFKRGIVALIVGIILLLIAFKMSNSL